MNCYLVRRGEKLLHQEIHDTRQILFHILVLNMNNTQTKTRQKGITFRIVVRLVIVAAAIYLNDGIFPGTIKINNVVADDLLPIKIQPLEFAIFELIPKQHFRQIACTP